MPKGSLESVQKTVWLPARRLLKVPKGSLESVQKVQKTVWLPARRLLKVPKGSLESVQKDGVAASTGAWVLQRSVEDLWRGCGAFEVFEGAKKQFRNPRKRNCGHGRCQKAVVLEQDTAATDGAKKQLRGCWDGLQRSVDYL